jgi:hypothetical protein
VEGFHRRVPISRIHAETYSRRPEMPLPRQTSGPQSVSKTQTFLLFMFHSTVLEFRYKKEQSDLGCAFSQEWGHVRHGAMSQPLHAYQASPPSPWQYLRYVVFTLRFSARRSRVYKGRFPFVCSLLRLCRPLLHDWFTYPSKNTGHYLCRLPVT